MDYKHLFDFSGYDKESPFYNDENKKVIGKMKDKLSREIIEEFVGLRAKMHSLEAKKRRNKEGKRSEEERKQKRH